MLKTVLLYVFLLGFFTVSIKDDSINKTAIVLNVDRTLIVFLSRTNNTKALAKIIQQEIGGDLVSLELKNPYPENYQAIVKQVAKEN